MKAPAVRQPRKRCSQRRRRRRNLLPCLHRLWHSLPAKAGPWSKPGAPQVWPSAGLAGPGGRDVSFGEDHHLRRCTLIGIGPIQFRSTSSGLDVFYYSITGSWVRQHHLSRADVSALDQEVALHRHSLERLPLTVGWVIPKGHCVGLCFPNSKPLNPVFLLLQLGPG